MDKLTIGKLAELAGVGVETVRFYQRKKLLREPSRSGVTFRTYSEEDAQRIVFIKKAQELGFTLAEVKDLLELNTRPRATCSNVRQKAEHKIVEIQTKIEALQKMKQGLEKLACACDSGLDEVKQYKVQECFAVGDSCQC